MLYRSFVGIVLASVASACIMLLVSPFAYAEQEKKEHAEEVTGRKLPGEVFPMCPTCKNVPLGAQKGKTLAPMGMVCPDCKNEIGELAVHHCDKCGQDVLACVMCKKASADLKAATMEGKCPKCKEVLTRPIKGRTIAKWVMKCPDCKKKSQEWLTQHCDTCDVDFLACPICKKEQEKGKK